MTCQRINYKRFYNQRIKDFPLLGDGNVRHFGQMDQSAKLIKAWVL